MKPAAGKPAICLLAVVTVLVAFSGPAFAKPSSLLQLSDIRIRSHQRVLYRCAGDVRLQVRYLSTNAGAFAYLPVAGRRQLFVSVTAASGTKYVSGRYVWWTQGEKGFLADETQKRGSEPLLKECAQVGKW